MVPRAQASELPAPTFTGAGADAAGIGTFERSPVLAPREVAFDPEAPFDGESSSLLQQPIEVAPRELVPDTPGAGPLRDPRLQCVHQPIETGSYGVLLEVGNEQAHPARDVEPHTSR